MRRIALLAGAAGALSLLTGCPPTYPKCSNDEHCKEHNEVCVQGQCRECATDANCKEGFVCDANKCVPKPECQNDNDCGQGRKCRAGRCVIHECESDGDCAGGGRCVNNQCLAAGSCSTNEDCPSGQECVNGMCASATCSFEPIRFDFNEHKLSSQAQSRLAELADCIKKQNLSLVVEGHADERGTEEYNLQLSNRRAASVKRYLVDLGVKSSALETTGYGENRPAVPGSDEEAWAANRRVEFNRR